jgi:hypothetical protein
MGKYVKISKTRRYGEKFIFCRGHMGKYRGDMKFPQPSRQLQSSGKKRSLKKAITISINRSLLLIKTKCKIMSQPSDGNLCDTWQHKPVFRVAIGTENYPELIVFLPVRESC